MSWEHQILEDGRTEDGEVPEDELHFEQWVKSSDEYPLKHPLELTSPEGTTTYIVSIKDENAPPQQETEHETYDDAISQVQSIIDQ